MRARSDPDTGCGMVTDFWGYAMQDAEQIYNQSWVREWAADVAACIPEKGFVSDPVATTVRSAVRW